MEKNVSFWYWLLGAAALVGLVAFMLFVEPPLKNHNRGKPDKCDITGMVVTTSGKPVTNFELKITPKSQPGTSLSPPTDNKDGSFAFSLPPGSYTLTCKATGYQPHKAPLLVSEGGVRVRVRMKPDREN